MSREANLIGYIKRTQNLFNSSVFLHSLNMSVTINLPIIHTAFQINSILNAKWNSIKYEMKSIEYPFFMSTQDVRLCVKMAFSAKIVEIY